MASDPIRWFDVADRPALSDRPVGRRVHAAGVRAARLLFFSSAYLALVAAAEVLVVQFALSLPPSPAPLVGALVTFAIYANDRLVDVESDAVASPHRAAFVRRHRDALYVLAAVAYGLGAALSALGGPVAFGLTLLPGVVWVAYAVSWIPVSEMSVERLKEVPVVSSVLVAVAWSLPVVMLPVAFADAPLGPVAGVLFCYFALGTFVNTELANVSDVESDVAAGVTTLPTSLGVDGTRAVLFGVTALSAVVVGAALAAGHLSMAAALALGLGLAALAVVLACLGRAGRDWLLSVAAECSRLPALAALVLFSG